MTARTRRHPRPPWRRGPRTPVHAFEPGDTYTDHRGQVVITCAVCKIAAEPGDARHPDGALPVPALPAVPEDARRLDARWLGERYE